MSFQTSEIVRRHNVKMIGTGSQTVVFGHGFGCNQTIWQHITPAFAADYQIILFDYMGCGSSDISAFDPYHYNSLHAYADDLIAICDALSLQDVYFVGHSVSGAIAMLASIKQPSMFREIIAISPSPRYMNDTPDYVGGFTATDIEQMLDMMDRNYFEWTEYLPPVVIGNNDKDSENELKQHFINTDPEICRKFAEVTFHCDIRAQLVDINIPVTILYCVEDVVVPVEVAHYLHQHIASCRLIKLDSSGHYPQLINPQAVIDGVHQAITSGH